MRTFRRFALGFASALTLAQAGAAGAGDITYPSLTTATTVQDTDLIATWRASGPLTKVQASVFEAYLQGKLSPLFLQPANNLSDVASVATARASLGLGSAATQNTGASGVALCLLNANCTWSGAQTFQARIATGVPTNAGAMFNLPPGAAPSSPVNGDLWSTSSGVFVQLNGATQQIGFLSSNVTSASQWATTRTETLSGDVNGSASVNGAGNWTVNTTLAASGVGVGTYGDAGHVAQITFDAKGRATGATSVQINYPSQLPSQSGFVGDLSTNGGSTAWSMRARAIFNGTNGALTVWGATNATITRLATGCYEISFLTPMPNSNYTFIGTAGTPGGSPLGTPMLTVVEAEGYWGRSTSAVGFCVLNSGSSPVENDTVVNVSVEAN